MSKPLRSFIGVLLLLTTVSLASCQSMINVMSDDSRQQAETSLNFLKSK